MKKFLYLAVCFCLCFALAACQSAEPAAADVDERLDVVTTIFPPYDFVRQLAGEHVNLHMLLSPGAESHSYEPTPQDMITIQNCDLFIYTGGASDDWVEKILGSVNTGQVRTVALVDLVEVVEEELVEGMQSDHDHDEDEHEEDGHDEDDHDEADHDHDEVEYDEHVWTSLKNSITIIQSLAATLGELDAENADLYAQNAAAYTEKLVELDEAFTQVVTQGQRKTLIFGDRFPFRYFVDAYGLDYYAAFPGCSTETEPSASTVAFLIDKVREEQIPVVFHIEFSNEKMADTICESSGARKLLFHSCHNITKQDFESGETYLSLMTRNLANLKEALQ